MNVPQKILQERDISLTNKLPNAALAVYSRSLYSLHRRRISHQAPGPPHSHIPSLLVRSLARLMSVPASSETGYRKKTQIVWWINNIPVSQGAMASANTPPAATNIISLVSLTMITKGQFYKRYYQFSISIYHLFFSRVTTIYLGYYFQPHWKEYPCWLI